MADIDSRLNRDIVAKLPEEELFWALMAPAWDGPGTGTPGQRALACVTYLVRDVDNGGLEQAIWNRDKEQLDEVHQALVLLGADEHGHMLQRAERELLGPRPPAGLEARRELIDSYTSEWLEEHLEPLNQQFYGEERLYPSFRDYIAQHPGEFFRP